MSAIHNAAAPFDSVQVYKQLEQCSYEGVSIPRNSKHQPTVWLDCKLDFENSYDTQDYFSLSGEVTFGLKNRKGVNRTAKIKGRVYPKRCGIELQVVSSTELLIDTFEGILQEGALMVIILSVFLDHFLLVFVFCLCIYDLHPSV